MLSSIVYRSSSIIRNFKERGGSLQKINLNVKNQEILNEKILLGKVFQPITLLTTTLMYKKECFSTEIIKKY